MTAYIFKQRAIVGSTLRVDQESALGDFLKSFSSLNGEDFLSFDPLDARPSENPVHIHLQKSASRFFLPTEATLK